MEAVAEVTTQVKNVPALRFPEFEGEWKTSQLRSITSYVDYRGKGPEKTEEGIFLVTAKNIKKGYIDYECSKEYVPAKSYSAVMSKGLPEVGDVLFTTEAPLGNVAQVNDSNIALAQRVIKFRAKDGLCNRYLMYFMLSDSYQKTITQKAIGTTVLGISGKDLHKTSIKFPSLPEQQKIASFITAVDEKLQQLAKKKELLEKYKKGVMQQLFSQQIRFKDASGNDFPEWEEKELREVAKRVTLKNKKNDINFVLTNSATQGIVSQQDYFDKDIANQENLEGYYVVDEDDFVYNPRISTAAPVGPIKRNKLVKGVMSPLYTVFRFEKQNLEFLEFFFETTVWHRYMKSVANYGARHDRMSISNDDLLRLPIPMPCKAEQQKITAFLSAVENKLYYTTTQLEQARQFKRGLLQQMFV